MWGSLFLFLPPPKKHPNSWVLPLASRWVELVTSGQGGDRGGPARSEPVVLRARVLRRARRLGGGGRAPGGPADAPGAEEAVAALTLLPSFLP